MEDIQERIESYIRGELTEEAEDQIWEEFLAEPELYVYFDTWLHVVASPLSFGKYVYGKGY